MTAALFTVAVVVLTLIYRQVARWDREHEL